MEYELRSVIYLHCNLQRSIQDWQRTWQLYKSMLNIALPNISFISQSSLQAPCLMFYILKSPGEPCFRKPGCSEKIKSISTFVVLISHSGLLLTEVYQLPVLHTHSGEQLRKVNPNNYKQNQTKPPKHLKTKTTKKNPSKTARIDSSKKTQYKANPSLAILWTKPDYGRLFISHVR